MASVYSSVFRGQKLVPTYACLSLLLQSTPLSMGTRPKTPRPWKVPNLLYPVLFLHTHTCDSDLVWKAEGRHSNAEISNSKSKTVITAHCNQGYVDVARPLSNALTLLAVMWDFKGLTVPRTFTASLHGSTLGPSLRPIRATGSQAPWCLDSRARGQVPVGRR